MKGKLKETSQNYTKSYCKKVCKVTTACSTANVWYNYLLYNAADDLSKTAPLSLCLQHTAGKHPPLKTTPESK